MLKAERFLIKLTIIQFIFLVLSQLIFHQLDLLPQLNKLTKYEGVYNTTFTDFLATFKEKR
ncbi:YpfB family protein [Neobacillus fumarioli]|uniref:YpfB family protein n=1 Tax=Neobacillus fumarioli TaxID=105229 RepID=UPI0008355672|nr:YpfB family protein [Neobacillus fumarioli]